LEAYLGKEGVSPIEDTETPLASADAGVTVKSMIEKSEAIRTSEEELAEEVPEKQIEAVEEVEAQNADETPELPTIPVAHEREHIIPITIASVKAKKKTSGLVYVTEDAPRIPILTRHDTTPAARIPTEELSQTRTSRHAGLFGRTVALAAIGVFAFLCAAAASFAFDYRIAVEGTQVSASVSLIEVAQ
jgi:hypothetical protein